jgi:hypothetical protein
MGAKNEKKNESTGPLRRQSGRSTASRQTISKITRNASICGERCRDTRKTTSGQLQTAPNQKRRKGPEIFASFPSDFSAKNAFRAHYRTVNMSK